MNQNKLPEFDRLFEELKGTDVYERRQKQKAIASIYRDILRIVLTNITLTNQHLTDLIQLFKHNSTMANMQTKLVALVSDATVRDNLKQQLIDLSQPGFVNVGKTAITGLSRQQLAVVRKFLADAFSISTKDEAITLCRAYDAQQVPLVKKGIYSPLLYYINPTVFPIVNNSHENFRKWLALSKDYPSIIEEYHELNDRTHEPDFAALDAFAHHMTKDGKLNYRKVHYLNGRRLYKISHGIFVKKKEFRESGIAGELESNNWISISRYTGKGGGHAFEHEIEIGDIVYVCYGGDRILYVAKVISDAQPFDEHHAEMIDDEEWVYREVEPLYLPLESDVSDLKSERYACMPSGNSTIWEVAEEDLEYMNDELFNPYFNLDILAGASDGDDGDGGETFELNKKLEPMSLNTILYGPPGTGKTFQSISHAVALIEQKSVESVLAEERELVKKRFDQYIVDGSVIFTTFHQSLSYEDFIEGIKPIEPESEEDELTYAVEDGIFKRICTEAAFSYVKHHANSGIVQALDFSAAFDMLADSVNERLANDKRTEIQTRSGGTLTIESVTSRGNLRVRHAGGVKTYGVSKRRLGQISQAFPDLSAVTNIDSQFRAEIGGANSSAYWAVLNAIRTQFSSPVTALGSVDLQRDYSYDDKKEIIKSIKADDYGDDNQNRYVLIVDEINRGNVSQIFGELITLIEGDKRLGGDEALTVTLPYSKERFGVPPNVFLIGTMNTADRSVEALDTALRRRFTFVPKMPEEGLLKPTTEGIDLAGMLRTINSRLRILKDADHTIGHAWLWNVKTLGQLQNVFGEKILPLLQEYFYNDYEKLGLVLGEAFFSEMQKVKSGKLAKFGPAGSLAAQYTDSWQLTLKDVSDLTTEDFRTLTAAAPVEPDEADGDE